MRPSDTISLADTQGEQTEAEFQSDITRIARLTGWRCYHTFNSRRSDAGYPDLTLVNATAGFMVLAELKTDRGKLTAAQREWIADVRRTGQHGLVWRPALMDAITEFLSAPARYCELNDAPPHALDPIS